MKSPQAAEKRLVFTVKCTIIDDAVVVGHHIAVESRGEILAMVDTVNRVRSAGGEISQADAKELIEVAFKSDADLVVSTINGYIADMEKGGEVSSGTQTGIEAIAGNLGVSANDAIDQITDLVNSNQ